LLAFDAQPFFLWPRGFIRARYFWRGEWRIG
jgi:hypothetical protein